MDNSNTLIQRQTLYRLAFSVGESHFQLQVALMKFYAMVSFGDEADDEVLAAVGHALAQLRTACGRLEVFLWTLSEQP